MIEYNKLILNGKSSADFPFLVAVEEMPGLVRADKKDKFYQQDYVNGVVKQSVEAYDVIELNFKFYLFEVSRQQLREFKLWIGDSGKLVRYDDPDMHYVYQHVSVSSEPVDMIDGYEVEAKFKCEPFEYEKETTLKIASGFNLINHTNAPMYPRITFTANTTTPLTITIGKQTVYFNKGVNGTYTIECKHTKQNVIDQNGVYRNDEMRGDFFTVPKQSTSTITYSSEITSFEMITRWGWR